MDRVAKPLREMGATVELTGGGLPMSIDGGPLRSIRWRSPQASAQVKGAVLLAATAGRVEAIFEEPALSRDHTERMLRSMGASVVSTGTQVHLRSVDALCPLDIYVPGDPSSAAYFVALALLSRAMTIVVSDVCLNATRIGFLNVLERMGARVATEVERVVAGEEVGSVKASPSTLAGTRIAESEVPSTIDELPLIACIAARAEGETLITGAGELRVKESDRLAAVAANLRAIGVSADELTDGIRVRGVTHPLRGHVRTHGDHRLAMGFGVLAALPRNEIVIDDRDCVAVSYPDFWKDLRRVAS